MNIHGIKIDNNSVAENLAKVRLFLKQNDKKLIFTPNPEMVVKASQDRYFTDVLNRGDINLCDGFGIELSFLFQGKKVKRITGIDFMMELCALCNQEYKSIFLLGGRGDTVAKARDNLRSRFPGLKIVGVSAGINILENEDGSLKYDKKLNEELIAEINAARPDVIFVGFGMGKQEKWLVENINKIDRTRIGMGVGGALDFISGNIPRAPLLMRKIGLEWVYRFYREPARFKRIFNATIKFLFLHERKNMVRTRFAPSPTGYLHVGGLRTALYAYLFAKKNSGKFILRIEDTDRERFVEDGALNILKSLQWAGIKIDEGVVLGEDEKSISEIGDKGPYIQSQRLSIYKKYAEELIKKGNAYYCFCTEERLKKLREDQQNNKKPTGYDGYCLNNVLNTEERIAGGEKHVIRLKMPKNGETKFTDLIRGEVVFKNELIDDQVLVKSDGYPTYHLAVVVDDHLMEITHVIRGEEWISSTPKHLKLYEYFGWEPPKFAHLPLLLNSDKSKLSKRQGDVAVVDYEKKGYLPEALVNFVAFLGWNPGTEREMFSLTDLECEFSLEKVNKTGAVFNLEKLDWFNKEHIKLLATADFAQRATKFVPSDYLKNLKLFNSAVALEKDRVKTISEVAEAIKFVFELPNYDKKLLIWRKGNKEEVDGMLPKIQNLLENINEKDWSKEKLSIEISKFITENNLSNGSVLWPLRVSLSGLENSPGPFEIAEVLGKTESLRRLKVALQN